VVEPYPSEKYESVGMMTFPTYGKKSKPPTSYAMWISIISWEVTISYIPSIRSSNVAMGKPIAKKHVFFMEKSSINEGFGASHSHVWVPKSKGNHSHGHIPTFEVDFCTPSGSQPSWEPSQVPSCSTINIFRTEIIPQSEIGDDIPM